MQVLCSLTNVLLLLLSLPSYIHTSDRGYSYVLYVLFYIYYNVDMFHMFWESKSAHCFHICTLSKGTGNSHALPWELASMEMV